MVMLSFNSASLGVPVTSWQRLQKKMRGEKEEKLWVRRDKKKRRKNCCWMKKKWEKMCQFLTSDCRWRSQAGRRATVVSWRSCGTFHRPSLERTATRAEVHHPHLSEHPPNPPPPPPHTVSELQLPTIRPAPLTFCSPTGQLHWHMMLSSTWQPPSSGTAASRRPRSTSPPQHTAAAAADLTHKH